MFVIGLPIPVVAVSAAVSYEQYGTDRMLVTNIVNIHLYMYACVCVYT